MTQRQQLPNQPSTATNSLIPAPEAGAAELVRFWTRMLQRSQRVAVLALIFFGICVATLAVGLPKRLEVLICCVCVFAGVLLWFASQKLSNRFRRTWFEDFIVPSERLAHAAELLASNSLELLPEERRSAFTVQIHSRLLEMSRGILEHQRFVDQVVDNMFEMMFALSSDGLILRANKSAKETTRYLDLVGQHFRKLLPRSESLVDYFLEIEIQFTIRGFIQDLEVYFQTADGKLLPFFLNGLRVESASGELLGYTIIAKNMSQTFRLIQEIDRSNKDLNLAHGKLEKNYDQVKKEIKEQEEEKKVLELELATSQLVQRTFLPQADPVYTKIEISGQSVPAAFCGGDWWNSFEHERFVYFFIGDVTGHGTASAMVTAAVSGYFVSLRQQVTAGVLVSVSAMLSGFNGVLLNMSSKNVGYAMTCLVGCLDRDTGMTTYANAGHNFPLLYRRSTKKVEALIATGDPLGTKSGSIYEEMQTPMASGDFLLLYTDGLIENKNEPGEPWGKKRLRQFIEKNYHLGSAKFVMLLMEEAGTFFHRPLEDDVTLVAVTLK